ncbi:MAG: hypothetical protein ACPG4X_14595 [Pikeienuella sp.]
MSDLLECINDDWGFWGRVALKCGICDRLPERAKIYAFAGELPQLVDGKRHIMLAEYSPDMAFDAAFFRPVNDGAIDVLRSLVKDPEQPLVEA